MREASFFIFFDHFYIFSDYGVYIKDGSFFYERRFAVASFLPVRR